MTHMLSSLAQGRVAILLEGGYNLDSISHSMTMCAKALLGDPLPSPLVAQIHPGAVTTIQRVVHNLHPYWSSLRFHVDLPEDDVLLLQAKPINIEDQLEQLTICQSEESIEILEAVGGTVSTLDSDLKPKTLQEFLILPENVEVLIIYEILGFELKIKKENLQQAMNKDMLFTVVPLSWCPHLEEHVRADESGILWNLKTPCFSCQDQSENWVCLYCYQVRSIM